MKSFDVIMIMVAVLQPIATALIGWLVVGMNNLNREIGELSQKIESMVAQNERNSEVTDRRFDQKQDK